MLPGMYVGLHLGLLTVTARVNIWLSCDDDVIPRRRTMIMMWYMIMWWWCDPTPPTAQRCNYHCQIHIAAHRSGAWWCLYLMYNIIMLCTNNENTGNTPHLWTRELINMEVLTMRTLTNYFFHVLFLLCVQTNQIFLLQIEHEEQHTM